MPIEITLDVLLAKKKVKSKDLAAAIGITEQNLSLFKQGKVKGVRLSTLDAMCRYLDCQPGDLLIYRGEKEEDYALRLPPPRRRRLFALGEPENSTSNASPPP